VNRIFFNTLKTKQFSPPRPTAAPLPIKQCGGSPQGSKEGIFSREIYCYFFFGFSWRLGVSLTVKKSGSGIPIRGLAVEEVLG